MNNRRGMNHDFMCRASKRFIAGFRQTSAQNSSLHTINTSTLTNDAASHVTIHANGGIFRSRRNTWGVGLRPDVFAPDEGNYLGLSGNDFNISI
jgi:hypothetical protein